MVCTSHLHDQLGVNDEANIEHRQEQARPLPLSQGLLFLQISLNLFLTPVFMVVATYHAVHGWRM